MLGMGSGAKIRVMYSGNLLLKQSHPQAVLSSLLFFFFKHWYFQSIEKHLVGILGIVVPKNNVSKVKG